MEIGWIDFSKKDRDKVLGVLDLLSETGVLDELGIAPIRDSFSDLFFPGTSTLQRRAKYFLIVPYALKDLELKYQLNEVNLETLDNIEKETAEQLIINNPDSGGIIGSDSIRRKGWVQMTPANIYLAGLRKYGIFNYNKSLKHYINHIRKLKLSSEEDDYSVNKDDDELIDDKNAGKSLNVYKLFISDLYSPNWMKNLSIKLTPKEADFLKKQIIATCNDSLMAYILKSENIEEFLKCENFYYLNSIIEDFPENIKNDYFDAIAFSDFNYALRVVYNIIVSNDENKEAKQEFNKLDFDKISNIDINRIMVSHGIKNNDLRDFLNDSKSCMINGDMCNLKEVISKREVNLKGINRSRTLQSGIYDVDEWFAGKHLNYRFEIGKQIIKDIYEGKNSIEVL